MLTLTETATTVVKQIVSGTPDATDGGLRIDSGTQEDRNFAISVVPGPQPGDALVESDGARIFLESRASTVLDDKVLDAQLGENGAVTFALIPQVG
jgi:iron-sulfur cluster assembly protein